jgi:molybdenum cofactor synthesis domain-containing protein
MVRAGILTVSDKGSRGEREDKSGEAIRRILEEQGVRVEHAEVVPDEIPAIRERLIAWADRDRLDLVLTTGGTGFSARDVTPEATLPILEKQTPGISEAIRAEGRKKTPRAILSRGAAGIRGRTVIVNLPGSVRAVEESLEVLFPALWHGIEILKGETSECGRDHDGGPRTES